jgi:L,D-transpeptidase catalytic domain/Putative peptidoglycan binding domain
MRRSIAFLALTLCALLSLSDIASARTMKQGDQGLDVKHLNQALVRLSYLPAGSGKSEQFSLATFHAVVAFQKIARLGRDGVAGPQTVQRLKTAGRPQPRVKSAKKHIEIDLSEQVALLVQGGKVQRTIAVSTAAPGYVTPLGHFSITRKERMSWSIPYKTWLPWASYFVGGIALHEYASVPTTPASHGCVRVPAPFAPEVYTFASMGTPVDVVR